MDKWTLAISMASWFKARNDPRLHARGKFKIFTWKCNDFAWTVKEKRMMNDKLDYIILIHVNTWEIFII